MIIVYLPSNGWKPHPLTAEDTHLLNQAIWIDLLCPTKEEEALIEHSLQLEIPSREEMQEIELSNRLYKDNDAWIMTATLLAKSDKEQPKNDVVTLMIKENKLITLRYIESQSFFLFAKSLPKIPSAEQNAVYLVVWFLEAIIDRLADIAERIGHAIDENSQTIFRPKLTITNANKFDYKHFLQSIGTNGDLTSKVSESLISFNLLISFFEQSLFQSQNPHTFSIQGRLTTIEKDIKFLNEYVNSLSHKVNFLLDATVGMISIEQNQIIRIFSIAAVIFLPPTLIASIYGMNFKHMPELSWAFGYPFSLGLMVGSVWLCYRFAKKRQWL